MLHLQTFGGLTVSHAERALGGATAQPRRLALLAVLARVGERGVSRERLLTLFWPDEEEERARRALAQALYALRRDLGDERAIAGTQELRVDADAMTSDVAAFAAHVKGGRLEEAAALYAGPFLDGFHLVGAPAFERWAEEERAALAREHARVLERLATAAERAGRVADAAAHWQALAAVDPLDARVTVRLMEALEAAGDRAAALRQARIYEVLVAQELELGPDRAVVALAAKLRAAAPVELPAAEPAVEPAPAPAAAESAVAEPSASDVAAPLVEEAAPVVAAPVVAAPVVAAPVVAGPVVAPVGPLRPRRRRLAAAMVGVGAVLAAAGFATTLARAPGSAAASATTAAADPEPRTLAIGMLRDFREGEGAPARPLAALLATNLARGEGVRVISAARIGEVQRQLAVGDSTEGAFASAARQAGATELVDGSLYAQPDGTLRLDLRRVELATGAVRAALTVRGSDLFALADSGTARLLAGLGLARLEGSVADVTTRSARAFQLYTDGLRAARAEDFAAARRLFGQALAEDSGFAMAAFEHARLDPDRGRFADQMARAVRLADRASPRERLMIRAGWALNMGRAELGPAADSLLARDPDDLRALLYAGWARGWAGEWAAARAALERAVALDSLALRAPGGGPCTACSALRQRVTLELDAGDWPAAERAARRRTRLQPQAADAWAQLAFVLDVIGRHGDADAALSTAYALDPGHDGGLGPRVLHLSRAGRLAEAEALARRAAGDADRVRRSEGLRHLAGVLRQQGRMREAVAVLRRFRADRDAIGGGRASLDDLWLPALALAEGGNARAAVALLDSIADGTVRPGEHPANAARLRAVVLAQAAELRAALGDTAGLAALVDVVERSGREAGPRGDRAAHHYVRGLLLAARGDTAGAIVAWRASLGPPPTHIYHAGVHLALAEALVRRGRPDEAVAVARAVLRPTPDGLAVTLPQIHLALARAHEAAGRRDSAAAHLGWVAAAWAGADPDYLARVGWRR